VVLTLESCSADARTTLKGGMELYHFHWLPRFQDRPRRHLADGTASPRGAGARRSRAWLDGITATARALALRLGWQISWRLLTSDRELTEDCGDILLCGVNVELLAAEAVPATS
jgi:hypothetical protein